MRLRWVLLVVAFPMLTATYFVSLSALGGRFFDYEYEEKHMGWLYAPFVLALVIATLYAFPLELSFEFRAPYLLSLVVGFGLYRADVAMLARLTDRRVTRGDQQLHWLLPVLAVAPAEEILFRGVLTILLAEYGSVVYVASSAVLFGSIHFQDGRREVLFKTGNGVVYCLLYLGTGSLLAPMLAHVGYNVAYIRWATDGIFDGR